MFHINRPLSPNCTKCSMLSVWASIPLGSKCFQKRHTLEDFRNGLPWFRPRPKRVGNESWPFQNWMESAGSLKSWFLHGIHFVNQKRNVRMMLHVNHFFGLNPTSWIIILHRVAAVGIILNFAWFRPRSVAKQQFSWKKICREVYFLEFWVSNFLASSDKKELGARWCKMFHINRPLSPNHGENGVSSKISRVNGNSGRGLAL